MFYIFPFFPFLFFRSNNKKLLFLFCVFLVILSGFRADSVGTDTYNYLFAFQNVSDYGFIDTEPLWLFLNKAVILMGGNFTMVKVFASILTILPLYIVYGKTKYPFFALFVYLSFYYYFYSFNVMRQTIAISWSLYAMYSLEIKDESKGWIWFIFAWGFHITAIIVPIFYYLRRFFNNKYRLYAVLIMSIFAGLFMSEVHIFFATKIFDDYSTIKLISRDMLSTLVNLLVLNIVFIVFNEILMNKKDKTIWSYFFFVFILLTNLMTSLPYSDRFIFYAGITLPIFFTELISDKNIVLRNRIIIGLLVVAYSYSRYFRILGSGEISPYINTLLNFELSL